MMRTSRWDLQRLRSLTLLLDSILSARPDSLARVSNPWLSFVRPNAAQLAQYDILFESSFHLNLLRLFFANILSLVPLFLRSISSSFSNLALPAAKIDCLLISHLINYDHFEKESDFYYDSLQKSLVSNGLNSKTLYINHLPERYSSLRKLSYSRKAVLPALPPLPYCLNAFLLSFIDSLKLLQGISTSGDSQKSRALFVAAISSVSRSSITNIARSLLIADIVRCSSVSFLIILSEGHSWERSVICASRDSNPEVFVLAYQHALLFPFQHSLIRPLTSYLDPDVLLTSSTSSHQILSHTYSYPYSSTMIYRIGSPRSIDTSAYRSISHSSKAVLFLPDGTYDESSKFLQLAVSAATLLPSYTFIIRFHPILSHSALLRNYVDLPSVVPGNLSISSSSLSSDILTSSYAVYSGSSSVSAAASAGLLCLRYDYAEYSPFSDPFAITGYRPPSFTDLHGLDRFLSDCSLRDLQLPLQSSAADSFYSPFQPEILLTLLNSRICK